MQNDKRDPVSERAPSRRRYSAHSYMVFRPSQQFSPPTDVIALEDRLLVRVEIAGMRASDFSITLHNHHLIITGLRERPALQNAAYHQVEIGYGEFRVDILLPWSVEEQAVQANYRDGFLHVELPRRPERQIHVVDVKNEETHDE